MARWQGKWKWILAAIAAFVFLLLSYQGRSQASPAAPTGGLGTVIVEAVAGAVIDQIVGKLTSEQGITPQEATLLTSYILSAILLEANQQIVGFIQDYLGYQQYLFSDNGWLQQWWTGYLLLVNGLAVLILSLYSAGLLWQTGLQVMAARSRLKALVPRLLFGMLLANGIVALVELLLRLNGALCTGLFNSAAVGGAMQQLLPGLQVREGVNINLVLLVLYAIGSTMSAVVIILRLAVINLLTLLAPIAALFWIWPQTQHFFWNWLRELLTWVFCQPLQLLILTAFGTVIFQKPQAISSTLLGITLFLFLAVTPFWLRYLISSARREEDEVEHEQALQL